MKTRVVAVVPARMQATRFPGKPMADIHGMPMVGHVYERAKLARTVHEVYAATCDREIHDYIVSRGGKSVMTADTHQRCSDRCAEAMLKIEKETGRVDILVVVQGDEPMVHPEQIDQAVQLLLDDASAPVACLMAPILDDRTFHDPNIVKVVVDDLGYALYFSREPIPSAKKGARTLPRHKQVPIIPFRRDYLLRFNSLPPRDLEVVESVDLLRVLEHGDKVKMAVTHKDTLSVDTPDDLARVVKAMRRDPLMPRYGAVPAQ